MPDLSDKASFKLIVTVLAIPALTLCGCTAEEEEKKTYEVGVKDASGGELQVADPQPGEVPVDLPQTPMKNVRGDEADDESAEESEPAE